MSGNLPVPMPDNPGVFLLYEAEDGQTRIEVRLAEDTVWLPQRLIAELFQTTIPNVNQHLKTVYEEGELLPEATIKNYLIVQKEGKREVSRQVDHYNLNAIISVGYRVKSHRGTQFRIWATERLQEYLIKGFTMDDERLKRAGGGNYFDELLARIRDIRSSERVFWKKVLDIYATSIDYEDQNETSQLFFKTIQNKMHWAAHGQTAPEVIHRRADATKPNMGLTSWEGTKPRETEVSIAKNYLTEGEIEILNRTVTAYLEFAELQALNRQPMYMTDWIKKLDDFLRLSDRDVLNHAGRISHESAIEKAEAEFKLYKGKQAALPQPVDEDFEKTLDELKKIEEVAKNMTAKKKATKMKTTKEKTKRKKKKE